MTMSKIAPLTIVCPAFVLRTAMFRFNYSNRLIFYVILRGGGILWLQLSYFLIELLN